MQDERLRQLLFDCHGLMCRSLAESPHYVHTEPVTPEEWDRIIWRLEQVLWPDASHPAYQHTMCEAEDSTPCAKRKRVLLKLR